jgi:hypothetical protein
MEQQPFCIRLKAVCGRVRFAEASNSLINPASAKAQPLLKCAAAAFSSAMTMTQAHRLKPIHPFKPIGRSVALAS